MGPSEAGVPDFVDTTINLPFDVGAIETSIRLPFDVLGPPVESLIRLPFDVLGLPTSLIRLPFDVEGPAQSVLRMPFDVFALPRVNEVQVITSGGVVTSYVLHFEAETTAPIAGTANAAAILAALEALGAFAPGDLTVTGGPLNTTDVVITFGGTYAGLDVSQITVTASGIVSQPPVGSTTQNGGPTTSGGLTRRGVPRVWQPMMVFDKAGTYLGSISAFNVVNPPVRYLRSRRVQNEGGMTFSVSRHSPDFALIASDRLVRLQSMQGEKPWWGTMVPQIDALGSEEITCADPFTILRDGLAITIPPSDSEDDSEIVNDGTPATAIYAKLMERHNDLRASTGEIQWELDLQGSRVFHGDLSVDADTLTALDMIVERSRTEYAWDSRLDGNRLVPILRVRDRFEPGAGAAFYDGPDGNIVSGAQVITDPTPLVFSLRLRGLETQLEKCLPDWAQWAAKNITPEITVQVDPGPFRNRQRRDESVDWGLSHAAIEAQCNAILDWLWGLYRSYVMAIHDIEGRPNHVGWAFNGFPDTYEPKTNGKDSGSRRAWRTRLQLVELRPDEPASAVMISEGHSQINLREWLVVRYNRVTGEQNVTVWAIETAAGLELIKWEVGAGSAWLYRVSGDRVISRSSIASTGAFVDPYNTRIYDPFSRRWRWLRRIINGPFALAYYIDPNDNQNSFVNLGVDAALSTVSGDGSSLISKMYDFERFAIEDWDPRRDGIGARLSRPTVFFASPTTRARWHVVSFNIGADASTSLTTGISSGDTDFEVDSIFGFPDPDLDTASFPFLATIDEGMNQEIILVISMIGTLWHVLRGQNGTDAIIHEAGAPVKIFGAAAWSGFPFPYTWDQGTEWAEAELAELSKQKIDVNVHIAHFRGDQLTIDYGSSHAVDVATEGPPGRWTGSGRVIGWSTDPGHAPSADDPTPHGGETEVVIEWDQ